jgi:hypothetical protein
MLIVMDTELRILTYTIIFIYKFKKRKDEFAFCDIKELFLRKKKIRLLYLVA